MQSSPCTSFEESAIGSTDVSAEVSKAPLDKLVHKVSDVSGMREWNLVSGGRNKILSLWDWKSGNHFDDVGGIHSGMILCIHEFRRSHYVTGSCDTKIVIWKGYQEGFDYLGELHGHKADVNCLCSVNDKHSNIVVSGSDDDTVRVWDMDNYECLTVFTDHISDVRDIKSLENNIVASASYDKTVRMFDLEKEVNVGILRGHISRVRCIEVVPEYELLFSGSYGRKVICWDVCGQRIRHELEEKNWVNSLHFFAPKKWLITGDDQGCLGWWDLRKMQKPFRYNQVHENFVTSIITLMRGTLEHELNIIATCSTDGSINVMDANSGEIIRRMRDDAWIFGLCNHERTFPDYDLIYQDFNTRIKYLNKQKNRIKIKIQRTEYGQFNSIWINRMFVYIAFGSKSYEKYSVK